MDMIQICQSFCRLGRNNKYIGSLEAGMQSSNQEPMYGVCSPSLRLALIACFGILRELGVELKEIVQARFYKWNVLLDSYFPSMNKFFYKIYLQNLSKCPYSIMNVESVTELRHNFICIMSPCHVTTLHEIGYIAYPLYIAIMFYSKVQHNINHIQNIVWWD